MDLYVDAPYGSSGSVYVGRNTANVSSEPAVASACQSTGSHYRFNIPLSAAFVNTYHGQKPYLYGLSTNGSGNPQLSNSGLYGVPQATLYKMTAASSNNVLADPNNTWLAAHVIDGNIGTNYSSQNFTTSANSNFTNLAVWLSGPQPVTTMLLTARSAGGVSLGFPQSYTIYLTNAANTAWISVGTYSIQPAAGVARITLGATYSTYGVQIVPNVLGTDNNGSYYFQMAEVALGN